MKSYLYKSNRIDDHLYLIPTITIGYRYRREVSIFWLHYQLVFVSANRVVTIWERIINREIDNAAKHFGYRLCDIAVHTDPENGSLTTEYKLLIPIDKVVFEKMTEAQQYDLLFEKQDQFSEFIEKTKSRYYKIADNKVNNYITVDWEFI